MLGSSGVCGYARKNKDVLSSNFLDMNSLKTKTVDVFPQSIRFRNRLQIK